MPSRIDLKEVAGYYQALGKFVDTFANVEWTLFLYLYALAGVNYDTARAIFSGVRIHDAVSFIKRITGVRKADLSAAMDDVLSQLLIINDVRNLILHHPASGRFRKGRFVRSISNDGGALTIERIKEIPISENILMDMEYDLFRMQAFLSHEYICLAMPTEEGRRAIERLGSVQIGAWLYKPAPQSKNGPRAPQSRRAKRTPPDESSPQ